MMHHFAQPLERFARSLVLVAAVLTLSGCGSHGSPTVPVSGRVTLDGQPVSEARVSFEPVGEGDEAVADQLIIPFALTGGGRFRTRLLSKHAETNVDIVGRFSDTVITTSGEADAVALEFSTP